MRSLAFALGSCGSPTRCHGDPENELRARSRLRDAEHIALHFPSVRVRGRRADAFLERVAMEITLEDDPVAAPAIGARAAGDARLVARQCR